MKTKYKYDLKRNTCKLKLNLNKTTKTTTSTKKKKKKKKKNFCDCLFTIYSFCICTDFRVGILFEINYLLLPFRIL